MTEASKILIRPVITEKAGSMKEQKKYAFEVAVDANKIEIGKAVEATYKGVEVATVNVVNMKPKHRRVRMSSGFTRRWKKALVTLKKGEIDFYK